MLQLREMLAKVVDSKATDLHLKVGNPAYVRENKELIPIEDDIITEERIWEICKEIMTETELNKFKENWELDLAYQYDDNFRFRINAFFHIGTVRLAFRILRSDILDFDQLNLPDIVRKLAEEERGLILVTGITGSGKSTTLATMLDKINNTRHSHIITIEDPIEFVHKDKKSVFSQREVGKDTKSFQAGLKFALRQDPDVILIGEMRDVETIRTAISAAETGHLVFSTIHTVEAPPTIDRILSFFSPQEQIMVKSQLSTNLKGVISQRLLKKKDGNGLVPALEILTSSSTVRKLIADGRIRDLRSVMQNRENGMQTFNQALIDLVKSDLVTEEEAMANADNPSAFKRNLEGGMSGGDSASIIGGL